jgi:hypothetical protein
MKTFPFPQILVSFLTMSTLLAFTPSKAEAYGDRECQFTIENNTNQVIDSLYIVPSSAEKLT